MPNYQNAASTAIRLTKNSSINKHDLSIHVGLGSIAEPNQYARTT